MSEDKVYTKYLGFQVYEKKTAMEIHVSNITSEINRYRHFLQ